MLRKDVGRAARDFRGEREQAGKVHESEEGWGRDLRGRVQGERQDHWEIRRPQENETREVS